MAQTVVIAEDGGVVEMRLNRPEKKNALTAEMYDALTAALTGGCARGSVRAFLISAEESAFTAGNDIGDFLRASGEIGDSAAARFVHAITSCSKPIVAAVNGVAVGVGMTLLLHCDLVYAAPDARMSVPFVSLGLVPEAGSSLTFPRLFGPQLAARLLLLGEPLSAAAALTAGLVCEIVPPGELRAFARAKAAQLAAAPPAALAATRALMRGDRTELEAQLAREFEAFARALRGPEAREAFTAFLEKRAPDFTALTVPAS
jgi:enoyl-CoA hydratase/carnithine racemase